MGWFKAKLLGIRVRAGRVQPKPSWVRSGGDVFGEKATRRFPKEGLVRRFGGLKQNLLGVKLPESWESSCRDSYSERERRFTGWVESESGHP